MITDPWFYLAAIPAVILIGLAKGGFAGPLSLIGVPLMALTIPAVQAAAIMLPILVAMDVAALWSYRRIYDPLSLKLLLPGAMAGIVLGRLFAASVTDAHVRLMVGFVSVLFVFNYWMGGGEASAPARHNRAKAAFWGTAAGFTSFISHAGGPPFQIYMLPLRLDSRLFAGTAVIFFAVVNAVKLGPYFALGQFSAENLMTSLVLMPLAPVATLVGAWLVRVVDQRIFYRIIYVCMVPVGLKLMWDGLTGLI